MSNTSKTNFIEFILIIFRSILRTNYLLQKQSSNYLAYKIHLLLLSPGAKCERRMLRIPFKPLSERMLQEPFWLGLITVMVVLCCIGLVWCAKRHFPEKLEKLLAEEADRSRTSEYTLHNISCIVVHRECFRVIFF